MPMCSMEQKRCISVASREGDEGEGRKKSNERENMEMTSRVEALKIFTLLLPPPSVPPSALPSSIFHHGLMSLGEAHLRRTPWPSCQPEVGTAADDLIWPDDGSSRQPG